MQIEMPLKMLAGIVLSLGLCAGVYGQPIKGIQQATKTVTQPLKTVQSTTKEVTQPIKETRQAVKSVTDAPKQVNREISATEKSINQAGNEVKKAKEDVGKAVDKVDGDKEKDQDSTAKTTPTKGVVMDERTNRDKVGDRDGYGNSGGSSTETASTGSGTDTANDDYRRVLLPPSSGKTNISGGSSTGGSSTVAATPAPAPKPDYSASPAREALESADFAVETLTDLFNYAVWDGPDKDHTMRSIDYMLKNLKRDIDEIRLKDPDHSVWPYEKKYRDWRNTYVQHGGQ